jgi:alpha-mannosidase
MKIHLIFNAHIDPVWLWPWQAGLDELLATCRSACDRLDAHPDLTFSRGEAWVYQQIEQLDPTLFRRIQKFIRQGRWEIVGGWWIQPDCNMPSGFALKRQIEEGKQYFLNTFGKFPTVGYNVDSFGHAAVLSGYMHEAGQKYYVMMRPQENEMKLPARLFRWRGYEGTPEIITFRIASAYCVQEMTEEHIRASLKELPHGIEDTMCFVGVGDHGGGPTERQIAWLREHWNAFEGIEFLFSTPANYFKTISRHVKKLPVVTGELQMHSIGCYSVYRPIKTSVRKAEHLLDQAERILQKLTPSQRKELPDLHRAWRHVVFNQFHDTMGGTCIPSAYPQVLNQVAAAAADADEVLQVGFRLTLAHAGKSPLQRIAIHNPSKEDFSGYVEHEPWRDRQPWGAETHLLDSKGRPMPYQLVCYEAPAGGGVRVLFPAKISAGKTAIYSIAETGASTPTRNGAKGTKSQLTNDQKITVEVSKGWRLTWKSIATLNPILQLIDDPSDTWSHQLIRYGEAIATPVWEKSESVENGPLRSSLLQTGKIGESPLQAEWRLYSQENYAELLLRVIWLEKHKLLKLTLPLRETITKRIDGVMGSHILRAQNAGELPLRDWTFIEGKHTKIGIVAPDVFALDSNEKSVRLTLLRSPLMANHEPFPAQHPRGVFADRGEHFFRFQFHVGKINISDLERQALHWQQTPLFADLTWGMPTRFSL